jgi:hypothetical protein
LFEDRISQLDQLGISSEKAKCREKKKNIRITFFICISKLGIAPNGRLFTTFLAKPKMCRGKAGHDNPTKERPAFQGRKGRTGPGA